MRGALSKGCDTAGGGEPENRGIDPHSARSTHVRGRTIDQPRPAREARAPASDRRTPDLRRPRPTVALWLEIPRADSNRRSTPTRRCSASPCAATSRAACNSPSTRRRRRTLGAGPSAEDRNADTRRGPALPDEAMRRGDNPSPRPFPIRPDRQTSATPTTERGHARRAGARQRGNGSASAPRSNGREPSAGGDDDTREVRVRATRRPAFRLIQELRDGRLVTARTLAGRLRSVGAHDLSRRRRSRRSGVPIDGAAGAGYVLRAGFLLPPLMFDRAEIEALAVGARMVEAWAADGMPRAPPRRSPRSLPCCRRTSPPGSPHPDVRPLDRTPRRRSAPGSTCSMRRSRRGGSSSSSIARRPVRRASGGCARSACSSGAASGRSGVVRIARRFPHLRLDRISDGRATTETFSPEPDKSLARFLRLVRGLTPAAARTRPSTPARREGCRLDLMTRHEAAEAVGGAVFEELLRRAFGGDHARSMKITRFETLRAKAISWVTTSMVRPSSARERITLRTSPTSSDRAPKSARRTASPSGRMARARGDRRALLLAAGEMGRVEIALVADADLVEQHLGLGHAFGARPLLHVDRPLDHVFEDRHVGPEVEALKNHAEFGADAVDLAAARRHQLAVAARLHLDRLAGDDDLARIRRLEQVDAAQERALAEPLEPRIEITSPSLAVSEMPFRTSSAPNDLCRL